jgi:hypothetical protein
VLILKEYVTSNFPDSFTTPFDWAGNGFYNGGYNTVRHGSWKVSDQCNATQLETPIGLRRSAVERNKFAVGTAKAVVEFVKVHHNKDLSQ